MTIHHEPTDTPTTAPTPVPPELYAVLGMTLGAVIEGPADNEVVWFNERAYCKAEDVA